MKKAYFFVTILLILGSPLFSQVAINNDVSTPDPSSGLDVKFIDKGVLIPRMTQEQIASISSPANGLVVFSITDNKFYAYITSAGAWKEIMYGSGTIPTCGSLKINHVAGTVAPITKSVTYGTITSIPGEPLKCWITSNLGADHQANSVTDNTEPSAGWYWQFNRTQGYKNDGTRTPNTIWITSISEELDWQTSNDPCSIELGGGWRIPTASEWTNVDAIGNWNNSSDAWNSALKLHNAGALTASIGSLTNRGSYGWYWSNTQYSHNSGYYIVFNSGASSMMYNAKVNGFPLRCLRNF